MKYIIHKGTETYNSLIELKKKINDANDKALNLAKHLLKEVGSTLEKVQIIQSQEGIVGPLTGINIEFKPKDWKDASRNYYGFYIPKYNKQNKKLWDRILNLPLVNFEDLNKIVGFSFQSHGLVWYNCPSVTWSEDYCLLSVANECDFDPNNDMEEILESKYKSLMDLAKHENKTN